MFPDAWETMLLAFVCMAAEQTNLNLDAKSVPAGGNTAGNFCSQDLSFHFLMISRNSLRHNMDYRDHIEINAEVRFGKPCVKGTRIAVFEVLGWLGDDMSIEEIVAEYPDLKKEDILACLQYSSDRERNLDSV